ncbi:hypothetical protein GCM10008965_34280 [Methylorubrum aminovorans]|nr:hypothetical protein GCM10025880_33480 [Methylorubrum aminovorans]
MQSGFADCDRPELRQDLGHGHGASDGCDLEDFLHDAVPGPLGAEAAELVPNLGEADLDVSVLVLDASVRAARAAFPA